MPTLLEETDKIMQAQKARGADLEEGDLIRINIPEHKLEVVVSDDELARRKAAWTPREPKVTTGYLKRYAKMVSSANKGAILEF